MLKTLRRISLIVLLLFVIAAAVVGVVIYRASNEGDIRIEGWVGNQLKRIVNSYLNPEFDFDTLDYRYPRTVVVANARLVADDSDARSGKTAIIEAQRLEIELARVPRSGEPIVIQRINATKPVVRLLADKTAEGFTLVGFDRMLRSTGGDDTQAQSPSSDKDAPPLSDVFRMQEITITGGSFVFDERTGDSPPMKLDDFTTTMTFNPDDTGWYNYNLEVDRKPLLRLESAGRLNLDDAKLDLGLTKLSIDLSSDQISVLPSDLQTLIRKHEITGELNLRATGTIPFNDWPKSDVNAMLLMNEAHFASGNYQVPVDQLDVNIRLKDGKATLQNSSADLLGGQVTLGGDIKLNQSLDSDLQVYFKDLLLQQLIRGGDAAYDPNAISGLVNGSLMFDGPLVQAATKAGGAGVVKITDGKLARLPILGGILDRIIQVAKITGAGNRKRIGQDTATAAFELRGDYAKFISITMSTPLLALDGTGDVGFDESLYLNIKAGPIKKLEQKLGVIGQALAQITDSIARYRVTGTLSDPKVTIVLLGAPDEQPPDPENPRETPASQMFDGLTPGTQTQHNDDILKKQDEDEPVKRKAPWDEEEEEDKWEQRRRERDERFGQ